MVRRPLKRTRGLCRVFQLLFIDFFLNGVYFCSQLGQLFIIHNLFLSIIVWRITSRFSMGHMPDLIHKFNLFLVKL